MEGPPAGLKRGAAVAPHGGAAPRWAAPSAGASPNTFPLLTFPSLLLLPLCLPPMEFLGVGGLSPPAPTLAPPLILPYVMNSENKLNIQTQNLGVIHLHRATSTKRALSSIKFHFLNFSTDIIPITKFLESATT